MDVINGGKYAWSLSATNVGVNRVLIFLAPKVNDPAGKIFIYFNRYL